MHQLLNLNNMSRLALVRYFVASIRESVAYRIQQ
jgi:hypothetical protein